MILVPKMIVGGIITNVNRTHLFVELGDWRGVVYITGVSDFFVPHLNQLFKVGEHHLWQVLSVDNAAQLARLSWKALTPRFQKDPFEFALTATTSGFKTLRKSLEEDKWLN